MRKKPKSPRVVFEGKSPILFTRVAVSSFAHLFSPPLESGEAKRTLIRLSTRTRVVHADESMHGISALVPDGVDVVMLTRRLPGLAPLVCTRVGVTEEDEYDGGEAPRRAA